MQSVKSYDRNISELKSLRLELALDEPFLLASVSLLSSGLEFIWENRKIKKSTALFAMRAELENAISIKRRSRLRMVRETDSMMQKFLLNK